MAVVGAAPSSIASPIAGPVWARVRSGGGEEVVAAGAAVIASSGCAAGAGGGEVCIEAVAVGALSLSVVVEGAVGVLVVVVVGSAVAVDDDGSVAISLLSSVVMTPCAFNDGGDGSCALPVKCAQISPE